MKWLITTVVVTGLASCYAASVSASDSADMKPGNWSYTSHVTFVSGPTAGQTKTFTRMLCNPGTGDFAKALTQASQKGMQCDKVSSSGSGHTAHIEAHCTASMGHNMHMQMAIQATSVISDDRQSEKGHGTESMTFEGAPAQMGEIKSTFNVTGHRIGNCPTS